MKRILQIAIAVNLANAVIAPFVQDLHAVFGWLAAAAFARMAALFSHEKNDTYPSISDEEKLK